MLVKKEKWMRHLTGGGLPYGLKPQDKVILHYFDCVANEPIQASHVVWSTTDAIGYELVDNNDNAEPTPSRMYTVPEGYVFNSPYGTYDAHRMMGWSDEQLKVNDLLQPIKEKFTLAPVFLPEPAPQYQIPLGYTWVGINTYHDCKTVGNWTDEDLIKHGYLVPVEVPSAIPQPAPQYQIPIGYIWIGAGTYHEARMKGSTDEGMIKFGYLVPTVAPSAVPVNMIPATGDKEPLKVGATDRRYVSESMLREDLDPNARYYDAGGIETIDVIKAKLTPEQLRGYLLGNLIKYSCRMNFKGSAVRDAEKCKFYSQWLAELEQENV